MSSLLLVLALGCLPLASYDCIIIAGFYFASNPIKMPYSYYSHSMFLLIQHGIFGIINHYHNFTVIHVKASKLLGTVLCKSSDNEPSRDTQ
jgi:hypothetical protein